MKIRYNYLFIIPLVEILFSVFQYFDVAIKYAAYIWAQPNTTQIAVYWLYRECKPELPSKTHVLYISLCIYDIIKVSVSVSAYFLVPVHHYYNA